jgi:NAD(P)-dependent dehydrogenase (short-subunit alcohol dehydrogenase family)
MSTLLNGRVAVITGASEGIGFATAKRFADEGAHVVIAARRQAELDAAVREIGHGAIGVQVDVSNQNDLDALFEAVRVAHGRIDILVANASVAQAVPLGEFTEKHIDDTLGVNIKGMAFTVQKALPLLSAGASIVLTSSVDNQTGGPGRSLYSASKAAERNLARSWLVELADRGIRVNAVAPGPTATKGLEQLVGTDDVQAAMGSIIPRGTLIQPVEVANAILFLVSDLASGVNGIELTVDGGFAQVR